MKRKNLWEKQEMTQTEQNEKIFMKLIDKEESSTMRSSLTEQTRSHIDQARAHNM